MAVINIATSIASIPLATRCSCALVLVFSSILFLLRLFRTEDRVHLITFTRNDSAVGFPFLVIVPGSSFWYPWTLVTSAFCETSFFEFVITAISLPLAGRYLERIWGPIEFVRFALVVVVGSNLIAWFLATVLWVLFRSESAFYGTQYHGMEALQTGFLVALAQVIPDHQVHLLGGKLPPIRVRDTPMAYVTFSNVACLLGYPSPFILIQFGWFLSWAYLRFYRYNPETGIRGDRSEAFSLVLWFPPFMHKPVGMLSHFLFGIFTKVGIIPRYHYEYVQGNDVEFGRSSQDMAGAGGAPVSARAEAERRRAMALKALDQRMAGPGGSSSSSTARGGAAGMERARSTSSTTTTTMGSTGANGVAGVSSASSTLPAPPKVVLHAPSDENVPTVSAPSPLTPTASSSGDGKSPTTVSNGAGTTTMTTTTMTQAEDEAEWPSSDDDDDDGGEEGAMGGDGDASNGDIGQSISTSGETKKKKKRKNQS